jgi:hypothetical protein
MRPSSNVRSKAHPTTQTGAGRKIGAEKLVPLNLLLWMAKEQPHETFVVRPVYHELGFRLIYIVPLRVLASG